MDRLTPANLPRVRKAMLVYQGGIASVFRVKAFNLAPYGRDAERLYQGDFRTAETLAYGLGMAGAIVRTAACTAPGDIVDRKWTDDLDSEPWSEKFCPQNWNGGTK